MIELGKKRPNVGNNHMTVNQGGANVSGISNYFKSNGEIHCINEVNVDGS